MKDMLAPSLCPKASLPYWQKSVDGVKTTHRCVQDFLVFLESEHFIYNLIYGT